MKKLNQKELKEIKNMISDYNEALKNGNETETLEDFINKIANETGIEPKETKIEENSHKTIFFTYFVERFFFIKKGNIAITSEYIGRR